MRLPALLLALAALSCQTRPNQEKAAAPPPAARSVPDAPLHETHWVLRTIGARPVTVPANTSEAFLTLRADGTAEGNGSCNRFRGRFFSETPGKLKFSPLMSTRMACPAIDTENDFTRALGQATTYRISGDTLRVLDATGVPVARLEAVYLR